MMKSIQRPLTISRELNDSFNTFCESCGLIPLRLILWSINKTVRDGLTPKEIEEIKNYSFEHGERAKKIHGDMLKIYRKNRTRTEANRIAT